MRKSLVFIHQTPNSNVFSDQELIDGCRKQSLRHQEALYKQYYAFAMSVCLRYTYSRDDALEVLNDSFMKVFRHIDRYDPNRPFKTWFRRILVNTSLDHYRMNRKYREHTVLEAVPLDESGGLPDYHVLNLDATDILKLFNELPDLHRVIFNLYEVEGYSHDEIAGMLDIAPGTSRSHLSRAKKTLATLYEQRIAGRRS